MIKSKSKSKSKSQIKKKSKSKIRVGIVNERRTQAERRAESHESLVRAAVALVEEEGVSAATFEAIGARAGYHRSLVTQRFGAKRGLIDAIIEYLHDYVASVSRKNRIYSLPGLEALLKQTDLFLRELGRNRELRAYYMLLSSTVAEVSELRTAFAHQHERSRREIETLVRRGQEDGTIRPEVDAAIAALMIGSLRLGVSIQLLVDPTMDIGPVRKMTINTLRASLAAPRE